MSRVKARRLVGVVIGTLADAPRWYSDPTLHGDFAASATFTLVRPCSLGLSLAPSYTLALTDAEGQDIEQLGRATPLLGLCVGQERIRIPVRGPVALVNQRLKLTIGTSLGVDAAGNPVLSYSRRSQYSALSSLHLTQSDPGGGRFHLARTGPAR